VQTQRVYIEFKQT